MARPVKRRRVCCAPGADYFKPRGIPIRDLEVVVLTMDEFEALRLADLGGLYQDGAGAQMGISRQTFGNILDSAHRKVADCVVNGKAIKIEGGIYAMDDMREFRCGACQEEWRVSYGTGRPASCPKCGSKEIHRAARDQGHAGRRRQCGRARCGGRSR
jgi:predicted DNA-binding protein (UPF0251 family)